MTEETTNETAANTATETKQTAYYLSNDQYPCVLVGVIGEFDKGVPYPLIAEAPDFTKLKNPKYDRTLSKWVEMDPESQGAQIAQLKQENDDLEKSNANLQSQVTAGQKQIGDLGIMVAKSMAKPTEPAENGGTN